MSDNPNANDSRTGRPGLSWFAAITAAAGLLAAFVIAILRLGKPPSPSAHPHGYRPATLPAPRGTSQAYTSQSVSGSRAQLTPGSPGLPVQALEQANLFNTATPEANPADTTRWNTTTKYIVGVGLFLSMVLLVYMSRGSLSMIIFAGLIAFVVRPLIGWFQRQLKLKRGTATGFIRQNPGAAASARAACRQIWTARLAARNGIQNSPSKLKASKA